VDFRLGGQQLPPLDSARAESLLAYLLLHRAAPQPRQRLAFLLWPGSNEGQAQTNLRKVLHNLRRALPEADRLIEIGPRTLWWRADAPLWLDVEQFEQALTEGRLEEVVEIYGGELLEGRYDEWLTGERERLAGLHSDALVRLARQREQESALAKSDPVRRAAPRAGFPARGEPPAGDSALSGVRRPGPCGARLPRVRRDAAARTRDRSVAGKPRCMSRSSPLHPPSAASLWAAACRTIGQARVMSSQRDRPGAAARRGP
jgi:hypothetical protein